MAEVALGQCRRAEGFLVTQDQWEGQAADLPLCMALLGGSTLSFGTSALLQPLGTRWGSLCFSSRHCPHPSLAVSQTWSSC